MNKRVYTVLWDRFTDLKKIDTIDNHEHKNHEM